MSGIETRRASELEMACRRVVEEYGLTKAVAAVLPYWAAGFTKGYIANELNFAESTIDSHVKKIYKELGLCDRPNARAKDELIKLVRSYM